MTDLGIYSTIVELLKDNKELALATIVSKESPTPAGLSSKMIIKKENFETAGTIGGGCLEAEIISKAKKVLDTGKPEIVKYRLDEENPESWLICGGNVEILIEYIHRGFFHTFQSAVNIIKESSKGIICTLVEKNRTEKYIISKKEWIGKKPDGEVLLKIEHQYDEIIENENPVRVESGIFLDPLLPSPELYVFGGGHISVYLSQFSKTTGFHTTVIDDRIKFASRNRFPIVDNVICSDFEDAFNKVKIGKNSYIVIVTRGHKYDELVLEKALSTDAFYIGMIGSKKKVFTIIKRLYNKGISKEKLLKVFSPIGLDIGAKTPEEIAVSIISEIIKLRRNGEKKEINHLRSTLNSVLSKV
ncbi:hypothetical protein DRQ09_07440 [candidate division KSB1 bacterium]|nr:MAG: hypothetical protein DRQ09_07440 [candidate division KSB1 bacterium]